jgi:hypothetical protein
VGRRLCQRERRPGTRSERIQEQDRDQQRVVAVDEHEPGQRAQVREPGEGAGEGDSEQAQAQRGPREQPIRDHDSEGGDRHADGE